MGRTAAGLVVAAAVLVALPAMAQETAKKGDSAAANTAAGAAPAAQAAADESAPAKRVALTAGVDFVSAYLFRGIFQEDSGVIVPPYADVGVSVYSGDGALKSVTLNGGIWNSLHSGPSGSGNASIERSAWYEADYYGSVTFQVGKWKPGALFTSYTSPNDAFGTVDELAGVLAYDDSGSAFPLNPKATLAFELKGQADGGGGLEDGGNKGTYFEFGLRPVVPVSAHPKYPVPRHPRPVRPEPQGLLPGRGRRPQVRLLRSRRHPQRAARVHEPREHLGPARRRRRALARRQQQGAQRRRRREAGVHHRDRRRLLGHGTHGRRRSAMSSDFMGSRPPAQRRGDGVR